MLSLNRIQQFAQTKKGRFVHLFLVAAIFNLTSCRIYKSAPITMSQIQEEKQILENLDTYKFFVHDNFGSYQLENAKINEDGSLSGSLISVQYEHPDSSWSKKEKRAYFEDHLYDINIYTRKDYDVSSASTEITDDVINSGEVTITTESIQKMTITSLDGEAEITRGVILVLAIITAAVLVLLLAWLIYEIIYVTSVEPTASFSEGSSDGSGDSGSDSDSDSGGSGSGGSGSGSGSSG